MTIAQDIVRKAKKKPLHFSLLDPDKQSPEEAGSIAKTATEAGSSAIMVGGSTLLSQDQVDETVKAIKKQSKLPVILFPSGAKFLSKYADAVFFMSLLNSRNLGYVIREHVKGAPFVKHSGIEPISMGYVIVEPGMTAGKVGEVDLIKRNDIETAVGYALAAQYLGMSFFYLEAGSGAPTPVPNEMISSVKKNINIPLVVGGGIRNAKIAGEKAKAGADIIVTGTTLEEETDLKKALTRIIKAIEE
ncbi:MAG: geranylgeranylglyceryl/heptaprenylglyceryl phosphate synthase [Candidatus Thermoplasmatota archaeon]|jgi:phosphoglycerol geranylgeranyltransferase|nr:geranylgeranylglyceryl/heptaprenylglyceryl phosphate synthase [Candidatus Thermoplasmatota archaeon]